MKKKEQIIVMKTVLEVFFQMELSPSFQIRLNWFEGPG